MRIHATLFPSGDSFSWNTRKQLVVSPQKKKDAHQTRPERAHRSVVAAGNRPHFGEVANNVGSVFVDFSQDVEDKRLHVKVKRLVVQEEFC